MGLEASLFQPGKSPYRQSSLRAFLGSRLAGAPAQPEKELPVPAGARPVQGLPMANMAATQQPARTNVGGPLSPAANANQPPPVTPLTPQQSSFNYDPVLAEIMAVTGYDSAQAETAATEGRRNVLLDYGDRALAAKILGANDPTVGAIQDDPEKSMSTLARIARAYRAAVKQNEDALSEGNLWFGGYRGTVLSDLAKQKLTNETDAGRGVQDALKQIGDALLHKKNEIRDRILAERKAAYERRLANMPPGWVIGPTGEPVPATQGTQPSTEGDNLPNHIIEVNDPDGNKYWIGDQPGNRVHVGKWWAVVHDDGSVTFEPFVDDNDTGYDPWFHPG